MSRLAVATGILLLGLVLPALATAEAHDSSLGIAPLDEDLAAMRDTLERLEALINARTPDDLDALIAPQTPPPRRQEMMLVVRALVDRLPAGGRYHLRTDVGRGAVVPVGPEQVQVQVRGTTVVGEERRGESVRFELVPVEREGRRLWLLTSLEFPRLAGTVDVADRVVDHALAAGVLGGLAVVVALVIVLRRRRRRRSPPPPSTDDDS